MRDMFEFRAWECSFPRFDPERIKILEERLAKPYTGDDGYIIATLKMWGDELKWRLEGKPKADTATCIIYKTPDKDRCSCNFCTRDTHGKLFTLKSRDPNRNLVLSVCERCLNEIQAQI